jgi:hypothetical protein
MRSYPKTAALVEWVAERAKLIRFSRDQMLESAQEAWDEFAITPEDQIDHERGRRVLREVEQHRLRRMGPDVRRS